MPESPEERLTAWLWEDERLTAGLDDDQAGSLLQWAARRLLAADAAGNGDLRHLQQQLRAVFLAARRSDQPINDAVSWAEATLSGLLAADSAALRAAAVPQPTPEPALKAAEPVVSPAVAAAPTAAAPEAAPPAATAAPTAASPEAAPPAATAAPTGEAVEPVVPPAAAAVEAPAGPSEPSTDQDWQSTSPWAEPD